MWDLGHPFPASIEIAQALYSTYGIVSSQLDSEVYATATSLPTYLIFERDRMGAQPIGLYHYNVERGYELRRMTRETAGKFRSDHGHFASAALSYQWSLPTVDLKHLEASNILITENVFGQKYKSRIAHSFRSAVRN